MNQLTTIEECIQEMQYLTELLESASTKSLESDDNSAGIQWAVSEAYKRIQRWFTKYETTVIPPERAQQVDQYITRFTNAGERFEVITEKYITALEAFEKLESKVRH